MAEGLGPSSGNIPRYTQRPRASRLREISDQEILREAELLTDPNEYGLGTAHWAKKGAAANRPAPRATPFQHSYRMCDLSTVIGTFDQGYFVLQTNAHSCDVAACKTVYKEVFYDRVQF